MENKIKKSRYVATFKDASDGTFMVSARPIDENSKYVVEFESDKVLNMIAAQSIFDYGIWGRYYTCEKRQEKGSKKVYLDIGFKPMNEMLKQEIGGPIFSLELDKRYENIVRDVARQLNEQALTMEANKVESKKSGVNK